LTARSSKPEKKPATPVVRTTAIGWERWSYVRPTTAHSCFRLFASFFGFIRLYHQGQTQLDEFGGPAELTSGTGLLLMEPMNKRPITVTYVGWLFLLAGVVGVVYHATEINMQDPFRAGPIGVLAVRLLAVVEAVFLFRAHNWARWLLVLWMGFHVVLSSFHSPAKLIVHGLLLALIVYILFRRPASLYFVSVKRSNHMVQ
jgi:hypothetical protein